MSIRVMSRVWDEMPYEQTTLLVLLCLADHADDNGVCWPSVPRLAKRARCSERWVRDVLGQLVNDGVLERELRPGYSSLYKIVFPVPGAEPQFTPEESSGVNSSSGLPRNPSSGDPGTGDPMNHKETPLKTPSSSSSPTQRAGNGEEERKWFEEFCDIYPKVERPVVVAAAWKLARTKATAEKIIAGAKGYARLCKQEEKESKFIATATNWLKEERWNDTYPAPATAKGKDWWKSAGD